MSGLVAARETRIAASPVRVRLVDTFTIAAPTGPVEVELERSTGTGWTTLDHPHQVNGAGVLAFVNLGRSTRSGELVEVRLRVSARGAIAETGGGDEWLVATFPTWRPDEAPGVVVSDLMHLFPGPSYSFPAGVPVLAGRVVDAGGAGAGRARVLSRATVRGRVLVEEVRTDSDGWFRLPLRWSTGATLVEAALGGASASTTVTLPAALTTTHVLTLS